jgi:DNA-binding response OmpR family regulator
MRLLVVEDEVKIANALKKGLEQESFAVDVAYDGDSGLQEALHEPYDLLILDRMLPGSVSGTDIIKKLREQNLHMPVLLLTAKDSILDKVEGLNIGADDYLTKPFSFDELLARIRALLRRPSETKQTILSCYDLTLNPVTFEVMRDGQSIQLSTKEFALLEYLLRNVGVVVSKDAIMQHVWNFDADILPNTVEVYVRYLRNKIDAPFQKPLIHTIRGFGYKIAEEP